MALNEILALYTIAAIALLVVLSIPTKHQKVGGIHFVKVGVLCVSFCVSRK